MTGTLPSELSYFEDTLRDLNIGGGSLSGSIPKSFERLKNLETFGVNDHCLTGCIPEQLSEIPSLAIFMANDNPGLVGSLNGFCNGTVLKEGRVAISADYCSSSSSNSFDIQCDCCICCDSNKFTCYDPIWGISKSLFIDSYASSTNGYFKQFEKQCLSFDQKEWIQTECPCFVSFFDGDINQNQCSNCTEAGAMPSHPAFSPKD